MMSDDQFQAHIASIDKGLDALSQFVSDCEALAQIAARYPRGTKLGNAVAHAHAVFMAKCEGVGATLVPLDVTEAP